jgi:epoxyqueuosine reductase QueG
LNTELTKKIEEVAYKAGADLVGFASVDRFADGMPSRIFAGAKSVVGIAFRVLRGSLRGIEDGTTYYQYTTTGVEALEETLMPTALLRVSAALEDEGYLGIPQRRNQQLKGSSDAVNPEMLHHTFYPGGAKELQLDFTEAAIACGLGERGLSGSLLTDAFGPLQRMVFVITDAELEPTPLVPPRTRILLPSVIRRFFMDPYAV